MVIIPRKKQRKIYKIFNWLKNPVHLTLVVAVVGVIIAVIFGLSVYLFPPKIIPIPILDVCPTVIASFCSGEDVIYTCGEKKIFTATCSFEGNFKDLIVQLKVLNTGLTFATDVEVKAIFHDIQLINDSSAKYPDDFLVAYLNGEEKSRSIGCGKKCTMSYGIIPKLEKESVVTFKIPSSRIINLPSSIDAIVFENGKEVIKKTIYMNTKIS